MYEYLYINRDEKITRKNERKKNQKYNSYISHKNSPDRNVIILDEQERNSIDK